MKILTPIYATIILLGIAIQPADARARPHVHAHRNAHDSLCAFHLHVSGTPDAHMTYWVAYGPLQGRFGVMQLHAVGAGQYSVQRSLPDGTTNLTFLAGIGSVHTRAGDAPGNPVVTIRTLTFVSIQGCALPTVEWQAPVG